MMPAYNHNVERYKNPAGVEHVNDFKTAHETASACLLAIGLLS